MIPGQAILDKVAHQEKADLKIDLSSVLGEKCGHGQLPAF